MPIRVDVSEGLAMTGFLEEISVRIGTAQYMSPVLKWVHQEMSDAFTEHMAALAPSHPEAFHHVYEWDDLGDPRGQLWRDVLVGGGNTRVATFEWLASKSIVPVVHPDAIGHVSEVHIFTWKAPVMEYDTKITIEPKHGEWLVYFTGPPGENTPENIQFTNSPITVQDPGGPYVKGAFTQEYVTWWAGAGAEMIFKTKIKGLLERDLATMPLQTTSGAFRTGTRKRTKTAGLMVLADSGAAEAAGRKAAKAWLQKRARNYIAQASARREIGGVVLD